MARWSVRRNANPKTLGSSPLGAAWAGVFQSLRVNSCADFFLSRQAHHDGTFIHVTLIRPVQCIHSHIHSVIMIWFCQIFKTWDVESDDNNLAAIEIMCTCTVQICYPSINRMPNKHTLIFHSIIVLPPLGLLSIYQPLEEHPFRHKFVIIVSHLTIDMYFSVSYFVLKYGVNIWKLRSSFVESTFIDKQLSQ